MQQQTINIHLILMKNQLVKMCNLSALFLDDKLIENLQVLAKWGHQLAVFHLPAPSSDEALKGSFPLVMTTIF